MKVRVFSLSYYVEEALRREVISKLTRGVGMGLDCRHEEESRPHRRAVGSHWALAATPEKARATPRRRPPGPQRYPLHPAHGQSLERYLALSLSKINK